MNGELKEWGIRQREEVFRFGRVFEDRGISCLAVCGDMVFISDCYGNLKGFSTTNKSLFKNYGNLGEINNICVVKCETHIENIEEI